MRLNICMYSLLLIGLLVFGCEQGEPISDATPAADDPNSEEFLLKKFRCGKDLDVVKVLTRNVYVGTDFDIIMEEQDPEMIPVLVAQVFAMLESTDFPARAVSLAREIKLIRPHLIGLQEISLIRRQSPGDFLHPDPAAQLPAEEVLYDYLDILISTLQQAGLNYEVAVVGQNIDIELPMALFDDGGNLIGLDDVRLTDYDVILARADVKISHPFSKRFAAVLPVNDLISIPSGYVAVTAKIGKQKYRFVNTHLDAAPIEYFREEQAKELLADLASETLPIIMLGDFNTPAPDNSTYNLILDDGYSDAWLEKRWGHWQDGDTFGHDADLRNPHPEFYERIDFIFYRNFEPSVGPVIKLGDEYWNRTPEGLWPSDHAGLAALFITAN